MKELLVLFLCIAISACDHSDTSIPICIQSVIAIGELNSLRVQEIDNELHYWLETGTRAADGTEFIVNSECDTVCSGWCFCIPPDCFNDYNHEAWEIIWQ